MPDENAQSPRGRGPARDAGTRSGAKEVRSGRVAERRIYVSEGGRRYVMPGELIDDPRVRSRLRSADALAAELALKVRP